MDTVTTLNMVTTNAIGPTPDEPVPSRYALRVGEIDVLVISDGVVTPPAESMATNADPAVRAAWLDDMFLPHDAFDWALNASRCAAAARPPSSTAGSGSRSRTSRGPGSWSIDWRPPASISRP